MGALFAALGLWVLRAHPGRNLNRALAAVLLLWAGSSVAFQLMRDAATLEAHAAYRAIGSLYEVPSPFLFAYIVDELFLPKPRTAARKAVLGALALLAAAMTGLYLGYPWETASEPTSPGPEGDPRFRNLNEPIHAVQGDAIGLALAGGVLVAAWAAVQAEPGSLRRRQALLVAVTFGFLAGHNAGAALQSLLQGAPEGLVLPGVLGLAAHVAAVALVVRGTTDPERRGTVALLLLPMAVRLLDGPLTGLVTPAFPGFGGTRFFWLGAFAIGLAVAILRYDLAGAGSARSARRARGTVAVLGLGVGGILAGLLVSWLGTGALGLGAGAVALAGAGTLSLGGFPAASAGLARRLTLDPGDPGLHRERARTYAEALRESLRRTGAASADDPALRARRADLGLSARDHDLLLSVLDEGHGAIAPGGLVAGRYRAVRDLGRGGFAEAFLARDEREGRDVVLKRLVGDRRRDAQAMRDLRREGQLGRALRHPHVVQVHGVEEVGGEPFLVLEYAPGGSLADRLRRERRLPEAEAARIGAEVLAALGALHAQGIVHRDVKPSNILFDAAGRAKLGDFTVAREVVSGETRGGVRGPVGTFPYLAPEQARGTPAGPAADLYALGATLYEALAGTPVLETDGLREHEAVRMVLARDPAWPLAGVSEPMNRALRQALQKDPGARFADAAAMARALHAAAAAPRRSGAARARR